MIGLSILSGTHVDYCQRLVNDLEEAGITDVMVLVGGTISGARATTAEELGFAVFPVGSKLPDIVEAIEAGVGKRRDRSPRA